MCLLVLNTSIHKEIRILPLHIPSVPYEVLQGGTGKTKQKVLIFSKVAGENVKLISSNPSHLNN